MLELILALLFVLTLPHMEGVQTAAVSASIEEEIDVFAVYETLPIHCNGYTYGKKD